jgi:hypothetical protein
MRSSFSLTRYATLGKVSQARVKSCYKSLNAELGLPAKPMTPSEFVPQLASDLKVPDRLRHRVQEYAKRAQEAGVTTGVRPSGFAAACLYKAGESTFLTQDDVAEAADTTSVTVRAHWRRSTRSSGNKSTKAASLEASPRADGAERPRRIPPSAVGAKYSKVACEDELCQYSNYFLVLKFPFPNRGCHRRIHKILFPLEIQ